MAKGSAARPCQGIAASGYPCRNRTTRPGGWCGRCRPGGVDSVSAARAVRGRLDEALPPPDPFISQRAGAGGWVGGDNGVYRLTAEGAPFRLVAETQIIEVLAFGPPSVGWAVFVEHQGLPAGTNRLALVDGFEPGWDAATAAAEISVSRFSAAARTATSPEALESLAASGDVGSVVAAAHPACPPDLLARLAEESACDDVVWAVASNPVTPSMVLARLPDDPGGWGTRVRVAKNRATPPGTLAELAGDPDPDVAAAARANPGFGAAAAAHAGLLAD